MAYVNVAEWTPEHVVEWLRGLEDSILPYVHFFLYNEMDGNHLLNLTRDDLNYLHIIKIGHQELILEAVDLLRRLHYGLNSETLQFVALKLGCEARSLFNDLKSNGPLENLENMKQEQVSTNTLSAVSNILVSVKSLISWLDRYPFAYQEQYEKIRKAVLKLSIELASTAQRDKFVERPHLLIKNCSFNLAELCDKIVQEFNDSLIIQPASLDIATIKQKPDEEIGMHIQSTYSGIHVIGWIKPQSLASRCAKIEEGDEIIQVNYQTVIGWQLKNLVHAMKEHPTEVHLTVKKRPRHTNILGQVIILRPYRIPSKKTAFGKVHKWSEGSLHIEEVYSASNDSENPRDDTNDDDDDDSAFLPNNTMGNQMNLPKERSLNFRMFTCPSHATVQRRATVSGASPIVLKPPVSIDDLVHDIPLIKGKDNVSRSISHDPSRKNAIREGTTAVHTSDKVLEAIMSQNYEDNVEQGSHCSEKMDIDGLQTSPKNVSQQNEFSSPACFDKIPSKSTVDPILKEKSSVQTSDILVAQEEDYVILENKSLTKLKEAVYNNVETRKVSSDSINYAIFDEESSFKHISSSMDTDNGKLPERKASVSCSLEDKLCQDIYFCGRRPSVQDISNEIADSKVTDINPVYLRKASKLPSPSSCGDLESSAKETRTNECSSYQVVIVGGVPQKCALISKESKTGSDFLMSKKKTNSLGTIGNRRIPCKDLGMGECQGWLLKLKDKKSFFHGACQWSKRWMVLKNHYLYSYRDKSDVKAESLVFLPGSTVLPVFEYRRKYCFKICQKTATLVFSTDSQVDLSRWVNKMGFAAIEYCANKDSNAGGFIKSETLLAIDSNFYSETDDSDDNSKDYGYLVKGKQQNKHDVSHISKSPTNFPPGGIPQKHIKSPLCESSHNIGTSDFSLMERRNFAPHVGNNMKPECNPINMHSCSIYNQMKSLENSYTSESYNNALRSNNEAKNRISYHRSFSCTDSTSCQPGANVKNHNIARKFSCSDAEVGLSLPYKYVKDPEIKPDQTAMWMSSDEEYDMLTSSLGRQKPVAKEITPGLVARMAVSYSNLSQKSGSVTNSTAKHIPPKSAIVPGYVAKISDSFDHLARKGNIEKTKCYQLTKSKTVYPQQPNSIMKQAIGLPSTKRSVSESHVTKSIESSSHQKLSQSLSPQPTQNKDNTEAPRCERHLSMLDREYHRLYGHKKASQGPLSPDLIKSTSSEKRMKFFPEPAKLQEIKHEVVPSEDISIKNLPKSIVNEKSKTMCSYNSVSCDGDCPSTKVNFKICQETHSSPPSGKTYECILGFKNQIQSVFRPQPKPVYPDFSKGIENIGFYSPDQAVEIPNEFSASNENIRNKVNTIGIDPSYPHFYNERKSLSLSKSDTFGQPNAKSNSAFKFFGSPKCIKKLSSPKPDKRNIFKSKKLSKELKRAEQKELASIQTERKIFGSPRLARAIFGSPKVQKKVTTVSSGVQTDIATNTVLQYDTHQDASSSCLSESPYKSSPNSSVTEQCSVELVKSSSNSSLNSEASGSVVSASTSSSHYCVETRIKPQATSCLPLAVDKATEESPSRMPLRPMMGTAMLGKKRLPSVSGESSVSISSSKGSQEESCNESVHLSSETKLEIRDNLEDVSHVLDVLYDADLSIDGVDLRARRRRTILMHFENKRTSQLVLELRALQRTLKDKESKLRALDELFNNSDINHEILNEWMNLHPDLFLQSNC